MNLVSNAIKFTDQGEVVIRVQPGAQAPWVEFSVSDTGIGIPQRCRPVCFAPLPKRMRPQPVDLAARAWG
jgi:K+-sensing histidine kinase KdpD